jgi:hypothetical protein
MAVVASISLTPLMPAPLRHRDPKRASAGFLADPEYKWAASQSSLTFAGRSAAGVKGSDWRRLRELFSQGLRASAKPSPGAADVE